MAALSIRAVGKRLKQQPYVLLLFPPLFWAGNAVLARGVRDLIPPISLSFWRWAMALLIVLPFTWRHARRDWPVARKNLPILTVLGFLGVTCFNTLLYISSQTTTAVNISLIQTAMPAIIILLSFLMFRERVTALQALGVLISGVGTALVVVRGNWTVVREMAFVAGDLTMTLAVVLYALYSVLLRKRPPLHSLSFLTYTFALGVAILLPLYLWDVGRGHTFTPTLPTLASILYVSIFPSILAYLCWNQGIALVGSNRGGLVIYLVPIFAATLAFALLGEALHWYHFVGLALIAGGMGLFNWQARVIE